MAFDHADAQIQFIMLDPYHTVPLVQQQHGKPTYFASFKTVDRLGTFKMKLNYTRKGYNTLDIVTKVLMNNRKLSHR